LFVLQKAGQTFLRLLQAVVLRKNSPSTAHTMFHFVGLGGVLGFIASPVVSLLMVIVLVDGFASGQVGFAGLLRLCHQSKKM